MDDLLTTGAASMKIYTILFSLVFTFAGYASSFPKNTPYRVCFTPGQQCTSLIVNTIKKAKHTIYVQAYSFTSPKIAKALVYAERRGVKVYVILDKSQLHTKYSQLPYLNKNSIPIWIDSKVAIAHNKVMVFDGQNILTGSFNFTRSAQKRNAENVIIIYSPQLAKIYLKNWYKRKIHSFSITKLATIKPLNNKR